MGEDLGFEKLLDEDGFFAHLFARSPSGADRKPLYGPDLPVVLLTGGPGMGKGRLLRAVRDGFAAKVPVIHLDCASPVYADRAGPEPDARSDATEALFEIAQRLYTWQGTGGSFAFPRFFTGLAMIATGAGEGAPKLSRRRSNGTSICPRNRASAAWARVTSGGASSMEPSATCCRPCSGRRSTRTRRP